MPDLTRSEMEAIINRRESVLYKGRILTRLEDLPSAADLAAGDSAQSAAVAADLDAQIQRLSAERAKLTSVVPAPVEQTETKKEREARLKAEEAAQKAAEREATKTDQQASA